MTKFHNYPVVTSTPAGIKSTYFDLGASRYDSSPLSKLGVPGATPTPAYKPKAVN